MSIHEEELLDGIVRAWVLQCLHILISKPKATDFHLCETESIYLVLRNITWCKTVFYLRFTLYTAWGQPKHWSDSCAIKSSIRPNIISFLQAQHYQLFAGPTLPHVK